MFNKRVKYEVTRKFGPNYLAEHQVRELDVKEMHKIKSWILLSLLFYLQKIVEQFSKRLREGCEVVFTLSVAN